MECKQLTESRTSSKAAEVSGFLMYGGVRVGISVDILFE